MQGNRYGVMSFFIITFNRIGVYKCISVDFTSLLVVVSRLLEPDPKLKILGSYKCCMHSKVELAKSSNGLRVNMTCYIGECVELNNIGQSL